MTTLSEAQDTVRSGAIDGIYCPCCGKWCKVYPRKLSAQMAQFLMGLVEIFARRRDWVHVREVRGATAEKAATDASYLVHWGLLIPKNRTKGEKSAGYYKPTQWGIDFVYERVRVKRKVYLYNNQPQDWSEETTAIREALGDAFDYDELFEPIGPYFRVKI